MLMKGRVVKAEMLSKVSLNILDTKNKHIEVIKEIVRLGGVSKKEPYILLYAYVKHLLREKLFFNNEERNVELLYLSLLWASKNEGRKSIRPKTVASVSLDNPNGCFTLLQKFTIVNITERFYNSESRDAIKNFNFNSKLEFYFNLFYEASCVERIKPLESILKDGTK